MIHYAILANPGHNRVYFESSAKLSLAELELCGACVSGGFHDPRMENIAGIPYYTFKTQKELSAKDIAHLSRLSFSYAVFRLDNGGNPCLYPVEMITSGYFDSGISTILKYTGKTNELFTRTMINVAVYSSDFADNEKLDLLDPVAGKGTTLFEGLRCGYQVSGIEIGGRAVQEACNYFKKYLETEKYKHAYQKERLSGENKSFRATFHRFDFAPDKVAFRDPEKAGRLTMVEGDSRYADKYFRKNTFHALVGDLPYGVAHGNVTDEKQSSLTRNPSELLAACLPAWYNVLKPGGALALAWNKFVLPREKLAGLLEGNGFTVLSGGAYDRFEHQVDRSIRRDIIVAKKK